MQNISHSYNQGIRVRVNDKSADTPLENQVKLLTKISPNDSLMMKSSDYVRFLCSRDFDSDLLIDDHE